MKKFLEDFKKFITRGNVMDMAVGVIVGGAFSKIVTSLVNDILMPLVALALGGETMAGLSLVLNGKPKYIEIDGVNQLNPEALLWNYGNFIQAIIDFLIIALVIFIIMRVFLKAKDKREQFEKKLEEKRKAEEAQVVVEEVQAPVEEVKKPTSEELLTEIRDLLANKSQE